MMNSEVSDIIRCEIILQHNRGALDHTGYAIMQRMGERAGSGVPDIYSIWKSEHFDDPIVDEASGREGNPDRTTLTLPMVEVISTKSEKGGNKCGNKGGNEGKKTEEIRQRVEAVYDEIVKDPYIKVSGLTEIMGCTRRQIEYAINELQAEERIKREGKTKGAH